MQRAWAIIERDLRRFRRSPMLIVMSLFMPVVQLVVLGHAIGGNIKHLKVAVVDQDGGLPAIRLQELARAVTANAATFTTIPYADRGQAIQALRNGKVNGVLTIPPGFSRRMLSGDDPRVALIEDNTDNVTSATLAASFSGIVQAYNQPPPSTRRLSDVATLETVELYPYVPYIQYLLPGMIVMSIFMMVMIGGGIIFIDDKARGLHEGYLVTPVTRLELIFGFNVSGAIKAMLTGAVLTIIGSVIAGIPNPLDPIRLVRLLVVIAVTSIALVSMMFLLMVRMEDPLLPRALFGVLNTLLWFPSGAIWPQAAFPAWMRSIAVADPFTYAVRALQDIVLKNTGLFAVSFDLLFLLLFTVVTMGAATLLFRRTLS